MCLTKGCENVGTGSVDSFGSAKLLFRKFSTFTKFRHPMMLRKVFNTIILIFGTLNPSRDCQYRSNDNTGIVSPSLDSS